MPKLFLQCPNCKNIITKQTNNINSNTIKKLFGEMSPYCEGCLKASLGKIELKIIKFDWETEASPTNVSSVPTKMPMKDTKSPRIA